MHKGYIRLTRTWSPDDRIELILQMPVEAVEAHPEVRANAGRIALQRGPIVYCLEETDNSTNLRDMTVSLDEMPQARHEASLLSGITILEGTASRSTLQNWEGKLYQRAVAAQDDEAKELVTFRAVPYYAWGNRTPGEMLVWVGKK
jgi:DUF1680 family protein